MFRIIFLFVCLLSFRALLPRYRAQISHVCFWQRAAANCAITHANIVSIAIKWNRFAFSSIFDFKATQFFVVTEDMDKVDSRNRERSRQANEHKKNIHKKLSSSSSVSRVRMNLNNDGNYARIYEQGIWPGRER